MKLIFAGLMLAVALGGCGIEEVLRRNENRYARPGAMDSPLTGIYNTYQFHLLDRYRVTHQWLESGCSLRGIEQSPADKSSHGRHFGELRIFEEAGKTMTSAGQAGIRPYDFDRYVRSVKQQSPIYAPATKEETEASVAAALERARRSSKTGIYESPPPSTRQPIRYEEIETGFQPLCFKSWWVTSHFLRGMLYKRDLASWRAIQTEKNPKGKWSERRVGVNLWLVQETAEQDFSPPPLNGVGGPFQIWLLPIGDTGYTLGMELGASRESLQYPDAHARFRATLNHLVESVKIEPLHQ